MCYLYLICTFYLQVADSQKVLYFVVEEADETVLWLEVLKDGHFTNINQEITTLLGEAREILSIFASARKKVSQR